MGALVEQVLETLQIAEVRRQEAQPKDLALDRHQVGGHLGVVIGDKHLNGPDNEVCQRKNAFALGAIVPALVLEHGSVTLCAITLLHGVQGAGDGLLPVSAPLA